MDKAKKEIVKIINSFSGKYSKDSIFSDFVQCGAIAISNSCDMIHGKVYQKREEQYKSIMKKYDIDERRKIFQMFGLLFLAMEENVADVLGEIYMESGCGSKQTCQFFTPFHISELTAETVMALREISEKDVITLSEPSVGGGGMIIAAAAVLKRREINYQKCLRVVAQDLDWRAVYMAYMQFSILGIDAEVIQGNTLGAERPSEEQIFRTPKRMGVLI